MSKQEHLDDLQGRRSESESEELSPDELRTRHLESVERRRFEADRNDARLFVHAVLKSEELSPDELRTRHLESVERRRFEADMHDAGLFARMLSEDN